VADPNWQQQPAAPTPANPRDKELLFGRIALRKKMISGPQLVEALLVQSASGGKMPLGEVLVERGALTRDKLKEVLALQGASRKLEEDEEAPVVPDAAPDPRIGKAIAGVRLDARLERKPLWVVFAGRRANDPEPVTLKLIDTDALKKGLWMDFLETVRACRSVQSPNVTPVLDVKNVEGAFALIGRYRPGFSLATLLERVRRIKLAEGLRIAKEAAKGLRDLHKAGLVHRAVRPDVIWLSNKGEVSIQDAGLAFEPPGAARVAERGVLFGSPYYIAPELGRGEIAEARTDTYALGCILYELVTGVRPFEGLGIVDLLPQHLTQIPVPPDQFLKDVPVPVSDLILNMIAKKKEERPSDDEVVVELTKLETSFTPKK
jgi:hypothetical protein